MAKPKKKITVENFDKKDFIIKTLRGAFKKSPLYSEALNRAKHEYFVESKTGKPMRRVHWKCASCGNFYLRGKKEEGAERKVNEVAVDHIEPVQDLVKGWQGYDDYVERLFCDISNLQVLCNYKGEQGGKISCHKIKTAEEKRIAAEHKKKSLQNKKQTDKQ